MKLKELEDFDWFPTLLRKYQMEFIGILASQFGFYKKVAQMIKSDMTSHKITKIMDLCSGSGLPAMYIHQEIQDSNVHSELSDKYPQQIQGTVGLSYLSKPCDVFDIQMKSEVYYTMYNAFHHFEPKDQQKIIQNALDNHAHLKIVEIVQPTLLNFMSITLASTAGVWLFCPWIRPFEWKRLLLTYLLPINVLTVMIDGYITILKSKTANQYKAFLNQTFRNDDRIKVSSQWRFPAQLVIIKISPTHA